MYQKGIQKLKENSRQGVSLAIVLCVSAFFVAFAAAILYTAGLLTSQSTGRLNQERCYLLAQSFAEVLDSDLQAGGESPDAENHSFYTFVNKFLDGKQYAEDTAYSFMPSGTDMKNLYENTGEPLLQNYGNLRVTLTKQINESESENAVSLGGTIPVSSGSGNYATLIAELERMTVRRYLVDVEVTAYRDRTSYTYTTEYTREQRYALNFSLGDQKLYWDGTDWRKDNEAGEIFEIPEDATEIRYEYDSSNVRESKFVENTYTDTDASGSEVPDPEGGGTHGDE